MLKTRKRVSIIKKLSFMKKYFSGFGAIVIAFLLVAFTTPKKNRSLQDMYVFEYDPSASGGYQEVNVENESNLHWKFVGIGEDLCDNDPTKACRVAVTGSYVNSTSNPTALSGVTIEAAESSTGVAYVTSITAPTENQFSNKE
jgi:hypothetical protein